MYASEFLCEAMDLGGHGMSLQTLVGNKWTLMCLAICAIAAVISNKVKGVQKLSIGFSWWGKHARVQVRVESLSSSHNRNSFTLTADGVFNSKTGMLSTEHVDDGSSTLSTEKNYEKQNEIAFWEFVPGQEVLVKSGSQVIATPKKATFSSATGTGLCLRTAADKIQFSMTFNKEKDQNLHFDSQSGFASMDWDSGVEDTVRGCQAADPIQSLVCNENLPSLPDWASCLLEPLRSTPFSKSQPDLHFSRSKQWDALLNMRVEMSFVFEGNATKLTALPMPPRASSPALLVRGPIHIARAKDKVVKIWDCSRRLFLDRLQVAEGVISALDVDWEAKKAFIGNLKTYFSVWDLPRGKCIRTIQAQDQDTIEAIRCNTDTCILTGARAFQEYFTSVRVWDSRALRQSVGMVSSTIPSVSGMESRGHECYVRDGSGFISAYDLRMLRGAMPLQSLCSRRRIKIKQLEAIAPAAFTITGNPLPESKRAKHEEEQWWDADAELVSADDYACDDYEESWNRAHSSGSTKTSLLSRFISAVLNFASPPCLSNSD
ncbi:hypothetical protein O6H91_03G113900 [Diphasiastrum complanatum]|uniref:Uncharacterized protein n=1 Tax=Diphasiastrum complanatum TaxID=34168 RepID=A0ACC2EAI3_DIPCM|nr:hypothetical protein O6H91_03G113900 [Diphasiastrum complanatum]